MKHLIMGTAGHIDHGKTTLIKALTGTDCDTHKEEKRRGITINLGFAHLDLDDDLSIGVVDVPGHKDFVRAMVAGASGIDFALMVVAADEGAMPQTREHLQIMDMLGIKSGLVALTRSDLAEDELVNLAEQDVRDLTADTFLDGCPIVRVSAVTGEGLDQLKKRIRDTAVRVGERPIGEVFRMFVDRVFSVSGFGTVVTGSVISGRLRPEGEAFLLPGKDDPLRVRRLERHGTEVQEIVAGDRASINLVGVRREEVETGRAVCDRLLRSTTMVDAQLTLFRHGRGFKLWNQVLFHLGTFEDIARVHLIDHDEAGAGETALAQIHLSRPCVVQHGDRFVLRSSSSDITLGGGEIIDAAPLHHRRRPEKLLRTMQRIAEGKLPERIFSEIRKRFCALDEQELADQLNVAPAEILAVTSGPLPDDIVRYGEAGHGCLVCRSEHDRLREMALKNIAAFHRRNALLPKGRTAEELMGHLGIPPKSSGETLIRHMLAQMAREGLLKQVGHTWAESGHTVRLTPDRTARIEFVERYLQDCGMSTPVMSELKIAARRKGIEERELHQVLRYLVADGRAYLVEGNYLRAPVVDRCRQRLLEALAERDEGMTVAGFRDLVSGNRRICLLMLALFDAEGVTRRDGDLRVLTKAGRELLAENGDE